MSRRAFVGLVAAPLLLSLPRHTYGAMTVARWQREGFRDKGARVLLDGRDITDDCCFFDDRRGMAICYRRNGDGRCYLDRRTDAPAMKRLRGTIEVVVPC